MGCQWSGEKADFHALHGGVTIDPVEVLHRQTDTHRYANMQTFRHTGIQTDMHADMRTYMHACMHTYISANIPCIYTSIHSQEHAHIFAWKDPAMRQRVILSGPSGEHHDVMAIREV